MSKPKISLIIPAHNEEKYIGECLNYAIKNSQGKIFEIIVVDNASSDDTYAIAEKNPHARVVREEKKGVMMARQKGFLEATGDILLFIDADNRIPNGWIDKVIYEFGHDKDLACLSGPYIFYDISKPKRFLVKMYWRVLAMPIYWIVGYMAVFGNLAIRRDVLEKMNGFDTTIEFYGDDTDTAKRAKKFGKVKFTLKHPMHSSARRLKKQGMFGSVKEYGLNFLSEVVLSKPITHKHKDFR